MKHRFGGLWTRKKLDVLEKYLNFYATALKNTPFHLHFVDAFAGTGNQDIKASEDQIDFILDEDLKGSVRIALESEPAYNTYHFNDLNPAHVACIEGIANEYPDRNVKIYQNDANIFVPEFCKKMLNLDRAVLFLDPYSTELDWATLKLVAKTKKIDLWLLFPISALLRMTPNEGARPDWKATLDRLLGTKGWESALYKQRTGPVIRDLFSDVEQDEIDERVNVDELKNWVKSRLQEEFAHVTEPMMLTNNNRPLFLFFFAVSNPANAAKKLADKVVRDITKSLL